MAAVLNRVILLGTIHSEPVMRQVSPEESACCFGLTTVTQVTTVSGQARNESCFIDVEVAGTRAQTALTMFHQNAKVLVVGRLRMLSWMDQATGRRLSRLVLRASQVQYAEASTGPVPEEPQVDNSFDPTPASRTPEYQDPWNDANQF